MRSHCPPPSLESGLPSRLNAPVCTYNIGEYIEIHGSIDPLLFERALGQVVSETETLRVQFIVQAGEPRQVVAASAAWSMPVIDVSAATDARATAEAWMKADLARPIDPTRGPLFGFALFKASPDRFFWYARYHHIIMDAFGMWLVARRLAQVYTRLSNGRSVPEEPSCSLAVLLNDDAAYRAADQLAIDRKFWCDYLVDRPEPVSLGARVSSVVQSNGFLRETAYLPFSTVDRLRSIACQAGTYLSRIMSAATAIFLHRLTGETDLVLGLPVAAREGAAQKFIPGMVSNVVPLRLALHSRMSVAEGLGEACLQIRRGLRHQRYQIADLRRDLWGISDGQSPFGLSINIMRFNYDFSFAGHHVIAHNLSLGPVSDLSIAVYERSDNAPLRSTSMRIRSSCCIRSCWPCATVPAVVDRGGGARSVRWGNWRY